MKSIFGKFTCLIVVSVCIAGCSSVMYSTDAVGVGYDDAELKLSPCACLKVRQKPGAPTWASTRI